MQVVRKILKDYGVLSNNETKTSVLRREASFVDRNGLLICLRSPSRSARMLSFTDQTTMNICKKIYQNFLKKWIKVSGKTQKLSLHKRTLMSWCAIRSNCWLEFQTKNIADIVRNLNNNYINRLLDIRN